MGVMPQVFPDFVYSLIDQGIELATASSALNVGVPDFFQSGYEV
jgi:hypothetical protein